MQIFEFLKKENENIQKVDAKLEKFHTIFNGIFSLSRAGRKQFEIAGNTLQNISEIMENIENDPLISYHGQSEKIAKSVSKKFKEKWKGENVEKFPKCL